MKAKPNGRKYTALNILSPMVQAEYEKVARRFRKTGRDVVECMNIDVKDLERGGENDLMTILENVRQCSKGLVNPKICVKEICDVNHPAFKSQNVLGERVFGLFAK